MAYQTPKLWVYTNIPTAADMNIYGNNLVELRTVSSGCNFANSGDAIGGATNALAFFQHQHRFLIYQNESHNIAAEIVSRINPNDKYSLPDIKDDTGGLIDLEQTLNWLAPGMTYTIEGCTYAFETDTL